MKSGAYIHVAMGIVAGKPAFRLTFHPNGQPSIAGASGPIQTFGADSIEEAEGHISGWLGEMWDFRQESLRAERDRLIVALATTQNSLGDES